MTRIVWLVLLISAGAGCQQSGNEQRQQQQQPPQGSFPYQILDRFSVGNQVYVRALAATGNRLWVGTSVGALEIDRQYFEVKQTYTRSNGLANEYIFAIHDSGDGVWLGTNGGGMTRLAGSGGAPKTYFPMHGLADYWVYSFSQKGDTLWVGTWAGLSRLDLATGQFKTYRKELVNEWVYGLAMDQSGTLWIGTEGGINSFDGKQWRVWTHKDGLGAPNLAGLPPSKNTGLGTRSRHNLHISSDTGSTYNPNYVFGVIVDRENRVWAGTWGGGVAVFNGKSWRNYTQADGLGGDIVYCLTQDDSGRIWAGSSGGVSVFDSGRWFNLGRPQGLPDNHVYSIAAVDDEVYLGLRGAVMRLGHIGLKKEK